VLLLHQLVRGEEDGVVEGGAASVKAAVVAAIAAVVVALVLVAVLHSDLIEGGAKFGAGGGEVLEEIGFVGELDEEGLVGSGAAGGRCHHLALHHFVQEGFAGSALVFEGTADRAAGVDEEAEGQREVVVLVEVADGLRTAVDGEGEVGLGEVLDEGAFFVADDDGKVDELGVDGDGRRLCWCA
jgi:hypothetical protein